MLSLIKYGQSRAVAEGVPVLLWVDTTKSTYGLEVQTGSTGSDDRTEVFSAEPTLSLETPTIATATMSELDDERLGLPDGLPCIRFNPDGFFDEVSISKIVIRQGTEGALEIAPNATRLAFEIRPATHAN